MDPKLMDYLHAHTHTDREEWGREEGRERKRERERFYFPGLKLIPAFSPMSGKHTHTCRGG
jgi:hypothetical protein